MLAEIDRTLGGATQDRSRALAATPATPTYPGFARRVSLPVTGGTIVPVPANTDVSLVATALNGTWAGSKVVNGPVGRQDEVVIKMRPIQSAGPAAEALALPVTNLVRSIAAGRVARFTFTAAQSQYAHFTVAGVLGASVSGTARLLGGATVLTSVPLSGTQAGTILTALPSSGGYILEITVEQAAGVTITGELLGGTVNESIGFPADVTRSIAQYATYRAAFDLAARTTVHLVAKPDLPNPKGELRLLGPDGSVLWSRSNVGVAGEAVDLALAAGHYVFTYGRTDAAPSTLRITSEVIDWLPLADGLPVDDTFSVVDLVADRNGRPVVGVMRHPIVGQTRSSSLQLRRFNGTAWEDVGSPITTSPIDCGNHTTSFAFDSTNAPVIVFASRATGEIYSAKARRLVGGIWQAIGPDDGLLPQSAEACDDARSPRLVLDAADRPTVAYRSASAVWIQRFDGTAWTKLATTAQDTFPVVYSAHDIALDPTGALWFALRGNANNTETTVVRRFDATSGAWQTVGPNGGLLPEQNTVGFDKLRLGFDTAGRPVIGGTIGVLSASRMSSGTGAGVYRFDGANWSTTGGYQLPDSYVNNTLVPGFAVLGNDVLMTWVNQYSPTRSAAVVQRNTPAGWSAFGIGADGSLAAYTAHALTPGRNLSDGHLLVVGSDVYMAAVVPVLPSTSNNNTFNIVLLRKTP